MDLIDATKSGEIALVLAVIVLALSAVVGFLFKLLLNEKTERVKRAEALTDKQGALFDSLEESTKSAVAIAQANAEVAAKAADLAQASLDELRKR